MLNTKPNGGAVALVFYQFNIRISLRNTFFVVYQTPDDVQFESR